MTPKAVTFTLAGFVMMSARLFAQTPEVRNDQQAYCDYVSQQAMAQRDLLRTPRAVAGLTQPNAALPMQIVWGVSSSLSDIKKAGLTMDVAQKNCELYAATASSQQVIQYALSSLERDALEHRLALIEEASDKLDALIERTTKMLDAQNVTRPMLFSLQTTRIKLDADHADTQAKIAALYVPEPQVLAKDTPIKELVAQKQVGEAAEQQALAKLSRQSDWDVALSFGARQQVSPYDNRGLYGAVTVSYNLASHTINQHLDQAAGAYDDWKKLQQSDVTRGAAILRQQVTNTMAAQEARLRSLQAEQERITSNLQLVSNADTTAAFDFHNQLTSAQLLLGIETGDASFRMEQLQEFLRKNY
jgi:hypothetical protein